MEHYCVFSPVVFQVVFFQTSCASFCWFYSFLISIWYDATILNKVILASLTFLLFKCNFPSFKFFGWTRFSFQWIVLRVPWSPFIWPLINSQLFISQVLAISLSRLIFWHRWMLLSPKREVTFLCDGLPACPEWTNAQWQVGGSQSSLWT